MIQCKENQPLPAVPDVWGSLRKLIRAAAEVTPTFLSFATHRIFHSEVWRFVSRIELETAARFARQAAQIGFLAAVKAMEEDPIAASDMHRFFPT